MKLRIFLILMITTALTGTTAAQDETSYRLKGSLSSWLLNDNNSYGLDTRQDYDEIISSNSLGLGLTVSSPDRYFDIMYYGNLSLFQEQTAQDNYSNLLSFKLTDYSSDNITVNLTAAGSMKRNEDEYEYYNVNSLSGDLSLKYKPNILSSITVGTYLKGDNYLIIDELDNRYYALYLKGNKFFKSRWSLSADMSVSLKDYFNQTRLEYYSNGTGNLPRVEESPVRASVFSFRGNIGKSITNTTGINMNFGGQRFIGDPIEAYENGFYYYTENDIYDDPSSYESEFLGLQLTKQIDVSLVAKLSAQIAWKDYSGTPALDESGELIGQYREDRRSEISFFLSKSFLPVFISPAEILFSLNLSARDNKSNDPYHDFNDNTVALGMEIKL